MAVKNTAKVIIGGKIITLGGYESEEYFQKVGREQRTRSYQIRYESGYCGFSGILYIKRLFKYQSLHCRYIFGKLHHIRHRIVREQYPANFQKIQYDRSPLPVSVFLS